MFLGPETSQETLKKPKSRPRSTQRAPKARKNFTLKNAKKCCRGKKCLKVAISFWTPFGTPFWSHFLLIFKLIFYTNCLKLFRKCWNSFWNPVWDQSGPRGPRWAQKSHQELQRTKNLHLQKPWKTNCFLMVFGYRGLSKKPQEAEEGSQKAPKKSKIPKNRNPKLSPQIIKYWNQFFGTHSETQAQPK